MLKLDDKIDNLEEELNKDHEKHGSKTPFTAENIKTAGENIDSATGGTEQSQASTWLGLLSRRSSGILGLQQEIKLLKRGTLFNKGFSIVGSAGGFAFMVISMLGILLNLSFTTIIIYLLGLAVGVFVETIAMSSEKAFIPKELEEEHSSFDKYDKTWFFGAKLYAIGMHISFAMSIATVIAMINMSNIEDNPSIQAMNKQIERLSNAGTSSVSKEDAIKSLNEDIASLRADNQILLKEKEEYIPNSKSKHERKAKDAKDSIDKIVAQINLNKKEITKKSAKRTSLQNSDPNIILEDKISKINEKIEKERVKLKKEALATAKENSGIGFTLMVALLLILVEVYGSYSSIKAQTKVQQMVGPEIAYGDRVVESLHSREIALNERDIALKAQKVKSSTKIAFAQNKMTEYEIAMAMETQRYKQLTRLQEHRMTNAKNKLDTMETEIMVETFEGMAEGIKEALTTKNRILESF